MKEILKCSGCGSYTLEDKCPKCSCKTSVARPAKFSPEDKYAGYRREAKLDERKSKFLI